MSSCSRSPAKLKFRYCTSLCQFNRLLIFWFPKYLGDVWHFDTKQVGWYGWLPYAFAGIGSLFGGAFSSWLMHRGLSLNSARKLSLVWGVSADLEPEEPRSFDDILEAVNRHEAASHVKRFVITAGYPYASDNSTDTIKVVERK